MDKMYPYIWRVKRDTRPLQAETILGKDDDMSALTDILAKKTHNMTEVEKCIVYLAKPRTYDRNYINEAQAAAEYAALVERLSKLETVCADVNDWLIRNNLGGTAHQRALHDALDRGQERA